MYKLMIALSFQYPGPMETFPRGVEQRASNILWAGDDGAEDHDRSDLQRLYI